MFIRLLALFILLPIVELAILIEVGQLIGLWPTLGVVVATGFLGAALARRQGLRTWIAIQTELRHGQVPARALVDGLLILIGGVVLLTPGILTDLFGFSLLVPVTRDRLKAALRTRFERAVERGDAGVTVILQ